MNEGQPVRIRKISYNKICKIICQVKWWLSSLFSFFSPTSESINDMSNHIRIIKIFSSQKNKVKRCWKQIRKNQYKINSSEKDNEKIKVIYAINIWFSSINSPDIKKKPQNLYLLIASWIEKRNPLKIKKKTKYFFTFFHFIFWINFIKTAWI